MFNGLYSGASAMNTLSQHQEIISSNLMHVNTPGHRRNIPAIRQRFDADAGRRGVALGPEVESVQRDFSAGRSVATGRRYAFQLPRSNPFPFPKISQFPDSQKIQLVSNKQVPQF